MKLRKLTPKERYDIWFQNNYETGFEYDSDSPPDYDDPYWIPTPTEVEEDVRYNVELGEEEFSLISRALDMYSRIGMLQFDYLTDCWSLQELVWNKKLSEEFKQKADELKGIFGYSSNANPGIFNKELVQDDCRVAAHIHQQIRHQLWIDDAAEDKLKYTVNAYPADVCNLARIETPKFNILNKK